MSQGVRGTSHGRHAQYLLLAAVFLVAMMVVPALSFAGPVSTTWVGEQPAPSSTLSQPAGVLGVSVFSSAALNSTSGQIKVDGQSYKTYLSNPQSVSGHWAYREVWDDDAEEWTMVWTWIPDPDLTQANLVAYAPSTGPMGQDGAHSVTASIKDANGTNVTDSWSFNIAIPPVIGAPSPADGSTLVTATPDITVPVSDNTTVAGWTATIGGQAATVTKVGGVLHITPASPLTNGTTANVSLTINDGVGATASLSWSYLVNTDPQAPNNANLSNCTSCHSGFENDPDMGAECLNCHKASEQHQGDPATFHKTANYADECKACHSSQLMTAHGGQQGSATDCMTCHGSSDPAVKAAIASGNSDCTACHTIHPEVNAEFQKASAHTLGSADVSHQQDISYSSFFQTLYSDFLSAPTQTNVALTNLSGGEVRLGQNLDPQYGTNPPAQTGLMFAALGGATNFDQYKPAEDAWDATTSALFTPASAPGAAASGASAFTMGGKVYLETASTCYIYTPPADPTADSWTTNTNFAGSSLGAGGDSAVSSARIYVLRGGGSNGGRVYFKPLAGSGTSSYFTVYSGAALSLSNGTAMAYSTQANRLFVINKNGNTSAAGTLLYVGSPDTIAANANATMTTGVQVTQSGTASVYTRMTCANIGGTDYLFIVGPNAAGTTTLQVVSSLSGVPVVTDTGMANPFGAGNALGDGCDLEYNAADGYLYAIRGGSTNGFARIAVPSTPTNPASWTSWQSRASLRTWAAGSAIAFANADPAIVIPPRFADSGTFGGTAVSPDASANKWGQAVWDATVPANTSVSVTVEGYNGSSWAPLTTSSASPIDLSSYTTAAYPQVRLKANLGTTDPTNAAATPQLNSWSVTSAKGITVTDASKLSCAACHGVQTAATGSDYCLRCHTGSLAAPYSATTPYAVLFRTVLAPFFTGWSKTVAGIDYASSAHSSYGTASDIAADQTLVTDFSADTLSNTQVTNVSDGEAKLATDLAGGSNPSAQTGLLFAAFGGTTSFDQYKPSEAAWDSTNSALFTPAPITAATASGASSYNLGGKIYVQTGSSAYVYTPPADPVAESWVASSNAAAGASLGSGSDSAVSPTRVYVLRGGSSSSGRIYFKPLAGSGSTSYVQSYSGASLSLAGGASMAYSNQANRLFVIYKNGSTSASGTLNWVSNPDSLAANANATFTVGAQVTQNGVNSVFTRMTCVNVGGTDYLFILGPNSAGTTTLQVVSNLSGAPVVTDTGMTNPFGAASPLADGCDLEYNAADGYLYAIRGGSTTGFARIQIPATPATPASWSSWQGLSALRPFAAGSTIAFGNADPLYTVQFHYFAAGSLITPSISAPFGTTKWGNVTYSATAPANGAFSVKVEGFNGTSWSTLVPNATSSPVDLSAFSTTQYPQVRVTGIFSTSQTTDVNSSPILDRLIVSATGPASAIRPSCQTCHTQHGSNLPNLVAYSSLDGSVVSDQTNAELGAGLCYECHGTGSGSGMDVQGPDNATYGHPIAASGSSHSSTETAADLGTKRHSDCTDCHNPHAAKDGLHTAGTSTAAPVLDGVVGIKNYGSWPSNFTALASTNFTTTQLTGQATDLEAYVCFKCHTSAVGTLPTVTTASGTYQSTDVAREFNPNNWSFHNVLGLSTAVGRNATNNVYTYKDSLGNTVNQTWVFPTANLKAGYTANSMMTCTDCHTGGTAKQASGPHGSSAKWMVDPAYPLNWETSRLTETGATSYTNTICGKCHQNLGSSNSAHSDSHHSGYNCVQCHIAIPHGWKRPRLLGYATDGAPYWTGGTGLVGFKSTTNHTVATTSASWSENDCYTSCGNHGSVGQNAIMP